MVRPVIPDSYSGISRKQLQKLYDALIEELVHISRAVIDLEIETAYVTLPDRIEPEPIKATTPKLLNGDRNSMATLNMFDDDTLEKDVFEPSML